MSDQEQQEVVVALAQSMVGELAPQELPGFAAYQGAFFGKGGAAAGVAGLTPVALAVASEVVAFIIDEIRKTLRQEAAGAIRTFIKRLLARLLSAGRSGERAPQVDSEEERPEAVAPPEISPGQLAQAYLLAIDTACRFNLSRTEAARLADTAVRHLVAGGA